MKFQPGFLDYFISPVSGKILESGLPPLTTNYIFIGNRNNIAIQSPAIIDIRLELWKIRNRLRTTKFILQTESPGFDNSQALDEVTNGLIANLDGVIVPASLTHNKIWIGNEENVPIETDKLPIGILPDLSTNNIWIGNNENRPFPNQRINNINLPSFVTVVQLGDNPISTTFLSSTVVIATSNTASLSIGSIIQIKGAQDTGGITADQLNINATVTAINSGASFSYVASGIASSTVSGGGGPNVSYYFFDPSLNYGIYNLYTGGTVNTSNFTNDPGPVASTTLRVNQSNLPNLKKGKMWIGVVNSTAPTITIDTNPPYFHVTDGSLNWDALGETDDTHAVPAEIGLNANELFVGNSDNSGEITTTVVLDIANMANLSRNKFWLGNISNRPVETDTLPDSALPNLTYKNIWVGNDMDRPVAQVILYIDNMANLSTGKLWKGNDSNRPVEIQTITIDNLPDLTSGNIWRGDSSNRPEESADLSNLENRVTDLENRVTTLESEVSEIQSQIAVIQGDIAVIFGTLAGIEATIAVIQGQIATLQAQVTALDGAVIALQAQVLDILSQIAVLRAYVQSLTLTTFVVGGPPDPTTGVIVTSRGPTCLLTNIPAGGDVDLGNYRIFDLATFAPTDWYDMEAKQQDAINWLFLWKFFGGGTR